MLRLSIAPFAALVALSLSAVAQTPPPAPVPVQVATPAAPAPPDARPQAPARPQPPTRDPHTPGYVEAKELPDGQIPPPTADGNFIIGPTHPRAPEMTVQEGVPQGDVYNFTMSSADSKIYPGIARDPGTFGTPDPNDPAKLIVTTSHPASYTRRVAVYVPKQYVPGTVAPFIVGADGPDRAIFAALDNLIAAHKVPVMIAISIGNGSGDAQGSERGLEYDTMSGLYAEWVESEVLPARGKAVQREAHQRSRWPRHHRRQLRRLLRARNGLVSPGFIPPRAHLLRHLCQPAVAAKSEDTRRRLGVSLSLIPNSPVKPIRIWMEVGDHDLYNPNAMRDNMHDWVVANENMAKALAAKGYHYQFVFARTPATWMAQRNSKPCRKPSNTSGKAIPSRRTEKSRSDLRRLGPAGVGN